MLFLHLFLDLMEMKCKFREHTYFISYWQKGKNRKKETTNHLENQHNVNCINLM